MLSFLVRLKSESNFHPAAESSGRDKLMSVIVSAFKDNSRRTAASVVLRDRITRIALSRLPRDPSCTGFNVGVAAQK